MKKLMSHNSVILNRPGGNKSRLMRRNKAMKKTFEPVCQEFGDNFVDDIAKTNRAELMDRGSP
jgi:hypothetical protein